VNLPPYELIATEAGWERCLRVLRKAPRVAVDVEANSLFAYREAVCLIQISVKAHDYIIDPLADFSIAELGSLFADAAVEKVFHASDYDLMLLKREYDWEVTPLFDTMWAGRILGYGQMGLASFLEKHFDVTLSKKHQKADWGKRPISEERLQYAQLDTHYLLPLRDELEAELRKTGRLEEAREIFENECRPREPVQNHDPGDIWSLRGVRKLRSRQRAILQALCVMRDAEAQRRDVPHFKVLSNHCLMHLAQHPPSRIEELREVRGISRKVADRMGRKIVQAIREGRQNSAPEPPKPPPRQDQAVIDRYKALLAWRKQWARVRKVESDVIMTRETLWDIAERNPKTPDDLAQVVTLGPLRRAMYAETILRELAAMA
jgi:ribonuclease D